MNSKTPFIAIVLLLFITLFFLQKSQTSISESNKAIEEVKEMLEKVEKKLDELPINSAQTPDSGFDPTEKDKFIAIDANVSTEISRGKTGKIDLEQYWAFSGLISHVAIEETSLAIISGLPNDPNLPPVDSLDLIDLQTYIGSSNPLAAIGSQQRYIEVSAGPNENQGTTLYRFVFQVKGTECDCWSNSATGYLSITVN
ncbi:MAG: hypothetical protein R3E32_18000 [Chitinophagales bacterium]